MRLKLSPISTARMIARWRVRTSTQPRTKSAALHRLPAGVSPNDGGWPARALPQFASAVRPEAADRARRPNNADRGGNASVSPAGHAASRRRRNCASSRCSSQSIHRRCRRESAAADNGAIGASAEVARVTYLCRGRWLTEESSRRSRPVVDWRTARWKTWRRRCGSSR